MQIWLILTWGQLFRCSSWIHFVTALFSLLQSNVNDLCLFCFLLTVSPPSESPSCWPRCVCAPRSQASVTRSRLRSRPRAQTSSTPVTSWRTPPWPTDSTTSPAPHRAPTPSPARCLSLLLLHVWWCVCVTKCHCFSSDIYSICTLFLKCVYALYVHSSSWINWQSCWDKTWQPLDSQRPSTLP